MISYNALLVCRKLQLFWWRLTSMPLGRCTKSECGNHIIYSLPYPHTCHIRTLYVWFPRMPKGFPLLVFLSITFYHSFCCACTVSFLWHGYIAGAHVCVFGVAFEPHNSMAKGAGVHTVESNANNICGYRLHLILTLILAGRGMLESRRTQLTERFFRHCVLYELRSILLALSAAGHTWLINDRPFLPCQDIRTAPYFETLFSPVTCDVVISLSPVIYWLITNSHWVLHEINHVSICHLSFWDT